MFLLLGILGCAWISYLAVWLGPWVCNLQPPCFPFLWAGIPFSKPKLITELEQGKETWGEERKCLPVTCPGEWGTLGKWSTKLQATWRWEKGGIAQALEKAGILLTSWAAACIALPGLHPHLSVRLFQCVFFPLTGFAFSTSLSFLPHSWVPFSCYYFLNISSKNVGEKTEWAKERSQAQGKRGRLKNPVDKLKWNS